MSREEREKCYYDAAQHAARFARSRLTSAELRRVRNDLVKYEEDIPKHRQHAAPPYCKVHIPVTGSSIPLPSWRAYASAHTKCAMWLAGTFGAQRLPVSFDDALEVAGRTIAGMTARRMPRNRPAGYFEDNPMSPTAFKAARGMRDSIARGFEACLGAKAFMDDGFRKRIQALRDMARPVPFKQRQVLSGSR